MNKILYIYKSHCGGDNFITDHELIDEQRFCYPCGTSDILLYKGTAEQIKKKLQDNIEIAENQLAIAKSIGIVDCIVDKEILLQNAQDEYKDNIRYLDYFLEE